MCNRPRCCGTCDEVRALPAHGGKREAPPEQADNISLKPKHGTNPAYALKRLKRDRPDLAELAEALRQAATMIEGGQHGAARLVVLSVAKQIEASMRKPWQEMKEAAN